MFCVHNPMDVQAVLTRRVASFLTWADMGRWECTSRHARARTHGVACRPIPWSRLACLFNDARNTYFVWVFQDAVGARWCIEMTVQRPWVVVEPRVKVHVRCSVPISIECARVLCAHVRLSRNLPWAPRSIREWKGALIHTGCARTIARSAAALAAALGIDAALTVDTNCGISDWIRARMHAEFARDDIFFRARQLVRIERTPTRLRQRPLANMTPEVRVLVPDYIQPNAVSDAVNMYGDFNVFQTGHILAGWTPLGCPIVLARMIDTRTSMPVLHIETACAQLPPAVLRRICDVASVFCMVRTEATDEHWTYMATSSTVPRASTPSQFDTPKSIALLPNDTIPLQRLFQLVFHAVNLHDIGLGLNIVQSNHTPEPVMRNVHAFEDANVIKNTRSYTRLFYPAPRNATRQNQRKRPRSADA